MSNYASPLTRRNLLGGILASVAVSLVSRKVLAQPTCSENDVSEDAAACLAKSTVTRDDWLQANLGTRPFGKPISVSRFGDRVYYLNREHTWTPAKDAGGLGTVVVPTGFVTDFASIPRLFWVVLAPDDDYMLAAVVHDWLYWQQDLNREQADQALRYGMEELRVEAWKTAAIYRAVRLFGQAAWDGNAELKQAGERRVLKRVPQDATVRWSDWKDLPDVF